MGEIYHPQAATPLTFSYFERYAQLFSPLWTHDLEKLSFQLRSIYPWTTCITDLHYTDPAGNPIGNPLVHVETPYSELSEWAWWDIIYKSTPSLAIVEGITYALVFYVKSAAPLNTMQVFFKPPPGGYPRGKMIRSTNAGSSWDLTDRGDMWFGEFGNPPLDPTPYTPPPSAWATSDFWQNDYRTSTCIRVATTYPCTLKMYFTYKKPTPVESYRPTRGGTQLCLDHYNFVSYTSHDQKETDDSMYHTFERTGLTDGDEYWYVFSGDVAFHPSNSTGPIFHHVHIEGPPMTTIRRPDAPGFRCSTYFYGTPHACPDHYLNVNEATPDEDASFLRGDTINNWWDYEQYQIPDLLPFDRPIEQVHVTIRIKRVGGYAYVDIARHALRSHNTNWFDTRHYTSGTNWHNRHYHFYTNPITGLPWTVQEVNDLQIGVSLRRVTSVGWTARGYCTQVYCKIYYKCEAYQ